ncbi:MAG TPA: hypothetical protein VG838_08745 [Opitutaceae bacterium]|nr:hypothetical protein [Opitutaceae bacterium]
MSAAVPVMWWNNTVVADATPEPVRTLLPQDGDSVLGFCAFVEALTPTPKSIKVFYHSPNLEHLPTTCPKGSRQTIQKALSPRFSALADPTTAWAAHRIRTNAAGTTTLLYIEEEPRLARVRAALDDRGIVLEGVFPLLVLLEATAPASRLDKPIIALLHTDEAAAVYWRTAEGDRHAVFFDGPTTRERAIRELVTGFSVFKTAPIFTVINAGSAPVDLGSISQKPGKTFSSGEFLSYARLLGPREVCNFLPPQSLFTADHVCYAVALILFVIAATGAGTYVAAVRAARANLSLQRAEENQLTAENARLRENKARIQAVNAVLNEIVIARPVKRRILEALNRSRPTQISIRAVALNESTWTVTGFAHEGVGVEKGPYQAFLSNFGKSDGWTVGPDSKSAVIKEPDFTLNGTIP